MIIIICNIEIWILFILLLHSVFIMFFFFFLVLDYHYLYSDMKILSIYFSRMSSVYTDIDFQQESFGYFRFSMLDSLYSHIVLSCSMIFSILVLFSIFFHLCSHILDVFDFRIVFRKMVLSCLSIFFLSLSVLLLSVCVCQKNAVQIRFYF